ncbi:hypothetical protein M408DRAFT_326443 [Serendipita vermifera MAFF 305830]|uniref:Nephrocystin 3-like N-terminal domain-containing protein n=1 Tax=Serendipita vermifera MAFF 305830 TaxID=933852 RepID=A0A0C3BKW5_SERVB|nr:hypothetical protein M408DRAFT_326443 [Serendipita vermifera MAFF 305830]
MFARLRMSVEEVLDEFDTVVEQVYSQVDMSPSERTARLRSCMEDLMKRRNYPLDAKLIDEKSLKSCACFVLSRLRINTGPKVCLRSYPVQSSPASSITIIEAALATCAVQPQFAPVACGQGFRRKEYIGAGIGANNPIREVIAEAQLLFGGDANVASLLSLGNGHPGIVTFPSGGGELGLSKLVWDMMNDCTQTAREVEQQIGGAGVYFRLSVEQGMQAEHCDEIVDPSWIVAQTETYMEDPATHIKVDTFARSIDAAPQPITITQLKSGQIPNVSLQLPLDLEKKQLHVVVTDPDDAILRNLKPVNLEYGTHVAECMEGTRQNILAEICRWMDGADAPNILWLKGYPGVGKSAIASSVMEQLRSLKRLGSSFFFQREKANSMTTNALWRVVAYDLARQYPPIKERIVAALKDDETIPAAFNIDKLFRQLIYDPLLASEGTLTGPAPVVVLDALDECGGLDGQRSEHRRSLLRTLKDWSRLPRKFKLFVTSRDESDIGRLFSTTSHHVVEVLTGQTVEAQSSEDIEKFLRFRFQEISAAYSMSLRPDWPGSSIIRDLTAKSQGLFIWVKVITNFADSGDPEEQLSKILCGGGAGDMAALYSFILNSFFPNPSEMLIDSFRLILGTIILAKVPFSVPSIMNFLSLKPTAMERICNGLQAVMDSRETLRIQHQSFVDFLIDPGKCPSAFVIDLKRENQSLTMACLRTMRDGLCFNICNLETSYLRNGDVPNLAARVEECIPPELSYSCFFWASHLKVIPFGLEEMRYLEDFMNNLFLYWLEALSLMKRVGIASGMLWILIDWIQAGSSSATMARDMQKFVATFGSIISQSAPHVYLSALPFAPQKSAVSRQYSARWDPKTGETVMGPMKGHTDWVHSVAFSPDGRLLVSSSYDETILVWDTETSEVVAGPLHGHMSWVLSVAFSPNGRQVVSGSSDCTIRVWAIEIHEMAPESLKKYTNLAKSIAFRPDGKRTVPSSHENAIQVCNNSMRTPPCFNNNSLIQEGWVLGPSSELLFWVLPDLRAGLYRPENTLIISQGLKTKLDLTAFTHGESWARCRRA